MTEAKTEKTSDDKPASRKKAKAMVLIRSRLTAGKLFSSLGVIKAGEQMELPVKEAKAYCDSGKAEIPFPDEVFE